MMAETCSYVLFYVSKCLTIMVEISDYLRLLIIIFVYISEKKSQAQ